MSGRFLPYSRQTIEPDDIAAVAASLNADLLTGGKLVDEFEIALARRVGAKHAVVCASGTAALHIASLALGLGPGDQVIVPAVTFLATANAPHATGAAIVFADVDPDSGLMTPATFDAALARAPRAKAVFPVHLAGQPVDLAPLKQRAAARGLALVEDACHALGGTYRDPAGTEGPIGDGRYADMAVFSFHPVKAIATGEGGAVTTNDAGLRRRLMLARNHGMNREKADFTQRDLALDEGGQPNPWYYEMAAPGFNYRLPDILCALGLSQLGKLDRFLAARRRLAAHYDRVLARLAPLVRPAARPGHGASGFHLYPVLIDFAATRIGRAALMRALRQQGIGTQVHYIPLHLQPYYRGRMPGTELPGAWDYYRRTLSLPLFPGMSEADIERVVEALAGLL